MSGTIPSTPGTAAPAPTDAAMIVATPSTPATPTAPASSSLDGQHPWPGLRAFEEADSGFFHGREAEAASLLRLVRRELLTVLFGRSGLGKTSLLQAGLFPALRAGQYLPVLIRLDHADSAPALRDQILAALYAACASAGVQAVQAGAHESLWSYFHRNDTEFWGARDRLWTPVLVFDQFEEMCTLPPEAQAARDRAATFLHELADLVENRTGADVRLALEQDPASADRYDFRHASVKLVLSFREDFLAQMEELNGAMPSLMYNRLRLLPMDGAQAYDVVCKSGRALVDDPVARQILRLAWKNQAQPPVEVGEFPRIEIDPAILCVVCSELNHQRLRSVPALDRITGALLDGAATSILGDFYERCMAGMAPALRCFVEDQLITDAGFRNNVHWDEALGKLGKLGVGQGEFDQLIARRLLHVDERQGQRRLELTHDVLGKVVMASRDQRRVREEAEQQELEAARRAAEVEAAARAREAEALEKEREAEQRQRAAREQERKNRRNGTLVLLGLLVMGILAGMLVWKTMEARAARIVAETKGAEALRAQRRAAEARARAREEQDKAKVATALAAKKSQQAAAAKQKAGEAERQAGWAKQAAKQLGLDARQQKQTADALLLASKGAHLMAWAERTQESEYDLSLLLNVEALRVAPTLDAQAGLLRRFASQPYLATLLHGHKEEVYSVASSSDGKRIATGDESGKIILWDGEKHKALHSMAGHPFSARSLAFSPDGKRLASAGLVFSAIIWDVESGQAMHRLAGHSGSIASVAFSPDGKRVATGSADRTTKLWDTDTGKPLHTLAGHQNSVNSVAFSPDGKQLATASGDKSAIVWDTESGAALQQLAAHQDLVETLAFSPDGKVLATASPDKTIILWQWQAAQVWKTLRGHQDAVISLNFSADGKKLVSAGRDQVRTWDVESGDAGLPLMGHRQAVNRVAINRDGLWLVWNRDTPRVQLWDMGQRKSVAALRRLDGSASLAYSPDGKRLAAGTVGGAVLLTDAANGTHLARLQGHQGTVRSVTFSPDGTRLASAGNDNTVRLWDGASGKTLAPLLVHTNPVIKVAFSPEGKRLASVENKGAVRLWDGASGQANGSLGGDSARIWDVAFSPAGKRLASAEGNNTTIWDLATSKPLAELSGHQSYVRSIAFSPDGTRLATGSDDKTVILWDVASGQALTTLAGHKQQVNGVAFSPDGKWLASASQDNKLMLWGLDSQVPVHLATLADQDKYSLGFTSVRFSPDSKTLAANTWRGEVLLWNLDQATLAAEACHTANRNLTCEEWRQHLGPDQPYRKTCPALPGPEQCK